MGSNGRRVRDACRLDIGEKSVTGQVGKTRHSQGLTSEMVVMESFLKCFSMVARGLLLDLAHLLFQICCSAPFLCTEAAKHKNAASLAVVCPCAMISIANVKATAANKLKEIYPPQSRVHSGSSRRLFKKLDPKPNDFCPSLPLPLLVRFGVIEAEDRLYKEWKIAARMDDLRASERSRATQKALNRFGPSLVEMKRASLRP